MAWGKSSSIWHPPLVRLQLNTKDYFRASTKKGEEGDDHTSEICAGDT